MAPGALSQERDVREDVNGGTRTGVLVEGDAVHPWPPARVHGDEGRRLPPVQVPRDLAAFASYLRAGASAPMRFSPAPTGTLRPPRPRKWE